MQVKVIPVGQLGTNCYILADEEAGVCAVIDPGDDAAYLAGILKKEGWEPVAILLTHGHFDHIMGIGGLRENWPGLPVYVHPADSQMEEVSAQVWGMTVPTVKAFTPLTPYYEGDKLKVGALTVTVLHTPGHSRGSVTLRVEDVLFTGDTLFRGSMGRTDFEGGSFDQIMASLARLAALEGDFKVCPGHEGTSTLDYERRTNVCVREALERA